MKNLEIDSTEIELLERTIHTYTYWYRSLKSEKETSEENVLTKLEIIYNKLQNIKETK